MGKAYTQSLNVEFAITPRKKFLNHAAVGFSGGGLIPADYRQFPVTLGIGASRYDRFEAIKGSEGYACVETLWYQQNYRTLSRCRSTSRRAHHATVWTPDANGRPDTPYCIAKDYPFRLAADTSPLTAIDTIFPVFVHDESAFALRDFKVVGGE